MIAQSFIAPFRIDIREITPDNSAQWFVLDTSQTTEQAAGKIKRHRLGAGIEVRTIPNELLQVPEVVRVDNDETTILLEQLGIENIALRREVNALTIELLKVRKEKAAAIAPVFDSSPGDVPLPFEVGALLRDIHTGVSVRVLALNPPHPRSGLKRPGFTYEDTTKPGTLGFVGIQSVGCFSLVTPAPELDPVSPNETTA